MARETGRREDSDDGDDGAPQSPWAGEVPVTAAPAEFTWAAPAPDPAPDDPYQLAAGAPPATPSRGVSPSAERSASASDSPPSLAPTSPTGSEVQPVVPTTLSVSRSVVAWGAAAVAVVAVIASFVVFGGDSRGDDDAAAVDDASAVTEPTDDGLPSAASDPPTTDPAEVDPSEENEPTSDPGADGTDGSADGGQGTGSASDETGVWVENAIEVPARLQGLAPVTIIVLGGDGRFHELDLPTGIVRSMSIETSDAVLGSEMIVGSSTVLIANQLGGSALLIESGGRVVPVDLPAGGGVAMQAVPTRDEYVGFSYTDAPFDYDEVRVSSDGSVSVTSVEGGAIPPWQRTYSPNGNAIFTDAGGVYEVDDAAAVTRVSDGALISASSHHLLLRECDDSHNCGYVLTEVESGERSVVQVGSELSAPFGPTSIQVSPDGVFVRYVDFTGTRSENVLVDVSDGSEIRIPSSGFGETQHVWTADGSGIVVNGAADGLIFFPRDGSEPVAFGAEFGGVVNVSVRLGSDVRRPVSFEPPTSGLSIIGYGVDGGVAQVEIDTGEVVVADAPPLASPTPAYIFPDESGATIVSYDNVPSIRYDRFGDDVPPVARYTVDTGPGGPIIPGPGVNTAWQRRQLSSGDGQVFDLVDVSGHALGPVVEIAREADVDVLGPDGAGGIVVEPDIGGVFVLGADETVERLTTGELLALGPTVAYIRPSIVFVQNCEDEFDCGVFRLDRLTGERSLVTASAVNRAGQVQAVAAPTGGSVSPDGNVAVVRVDGGANQILFVDVPSGEWTRAPAVDRSTPIIWTDDSRYAVYLSDDQLRLYERETHSIRRITTEFDLKAIAALPVASGGS